MALSAMLKACLSKAKIKYKSHKHPVAYTAQEIAAAQHVPGKQLVKCVLVHTDTGYVLAVLQAIHLVDLAKLKKLLKAKTLTLAKESEIKKTFPDLEIGAMPPFGNFYGVPVIADKALTAAEEIVCNAGTHTETIKLRYRDFEQLVKPRIGVFGLHISKARKSKR